MNKKPKLVERVLVSSPWTVRCCWVAFKFFLLGRETKSGGGGGDRKAEEEEEDGGGWRMEALVIRWFLHVLILLLNLEAEGRDGFCRHVALS